MTDRSSIISNWREGRRQVTKDENKTRGRHKRRGHRRVEEPSPSTTPPLSRHAHHQTSSSSLTDVPGTQSPPPGVVEGQEEQETSRGSPASTQHHSNSNDPSFHSASSEAPSLSWPASENPLAAHFCLAKIEQAKAKKNLVLDCLPIFAFNGPDAAPDQTWLKDCLKHNMSACDVCIRVYHNSLTPHRTKLGSRTV
ncbi:hypothetical protein BC567DRAFT_300236 [Phyllosticta citribraziliensis]